MPVLLAEFITGVLFSSVDEWMVECEHGQEPLIIALFLSRLWANFDL